MNANKDSAHVWRMKLWPMMILAALPIFIGGCATPATYQGMTPTTVEVTKKHPRTVKLAVSGGQETEATGKPRISDAALLQALTDAIVKSQTFSQVINSSSADYLLNVTIFSLEQPSIGFTFTVKMEAGWTLTRSDRNSVVWQEAINSEHTVTVGQEFAAVDRLRVATEGAARNNIIQGLRKISQLDLDATAPASTSQQSLSPKKPTTPSDNSVANKLRELQKLRKEGVITEDEFQTKKKQLLEKL